MRDGVDLFLRRGRNPTPFIYTAGHWWLRNRTALSRYYKHTWPAEKIASGEVAGASGCAPLYRRAMLESVDLGQGEYFDDTFFLYMEDVDLDWRARRAGWTCWFEKVAVAYHEAEASGGLDDPRIYGQMLGNRAAMILKNDTLGNFPPALAVHSEGGSETVLARIDPARRRTGGGSARPGRAVG